MLVLSRKRDEKIFIGDDIVITVVRIGAMDVRLGIEAPMSYAIHRDDIVDKQQRGPEDD